MTSKEYQLVPEEYTEDDEALLHNTKSRRIWHPTSLLTKTLIVALALSLLGNALWVVQHIRANPTSEYSVRTKYAGLQRNVPIPWAESDFGSHNRTILDKAWENVAEESDIGFITLNDDFVAEKGLPMAQRWPWDDTKGLYLLHGYHNLHCLTVLRTALFEMHDGLPQSVHFSHLNHCLDAFRQDVICNADDTPRYTGHHKRGAPSSGMGQVRMCKDWGKLETWAKQHSSCYKYEPGRITPDGIPFGLFKHCPDGSKPWEGMEE